MSLLNPWVILSILIAIGAAFGGGYSKGKDVEYQRQQLEIAALNAKARETEKAMAQVAQSYGDTLRKANNVARVKETKLRADIATGNLRLSIPTQGSVCPSPDTASATGSNSGEAGAEPGGSTDVAADLLQIAADGDAAIRKLNTCIQTYEQMRTMK